MATLSAERVIDSWFALVKNGAGKDQWLIDTTEQALKNSAVPNLACQKEVVSTGMFGEKRNFLMVVHRALREYAMFIGARNFGPDLDVSWYMTINPGFFKRALSKQMASGNPMALSMSLDVFSQQDLSAYKQFVHNCVQEILQDLMKELQQDYSRTDRRSKGFLSVW
jgi:hypothetical protein